MHNFIHILVLADIQQFVQNALNSLSGDDRLMNLNALKMNVYIFFLYIKTYEEKISKNTDNLITDKVIIFL